MEDGDFRVFSKNVKTMKKNLPIIPKTAGRGSMLAFSFLFLAACMQHDESLAPGNHHNLISQGDLASMEGGVAAMTKRTFTAHLNSGNEVASPAVESLGQGQAIFTFSEDGMEIHYKLIVANIENVTMAHIHCGEAGANGPPVVFLFGPVAGGVTQNGVLAEGTITSANIRPNVSCSGVIATYELLAELIRTGGAYVNAHTTAYPGGEIRGQIK